ncbi:MAG TPA: phospholipase [Anaerolineae bacterium]
MNKGPHEGQPVAFAGQPLDRAQAAMIMLHGRGATSQDILSLVPLLAQPHFAYLAPQANGNTWYPNRYLDPIADNEPWLSSALALVDQVLGQVGEAGIPPERTMLLGFSQGACLTLEFVARHARRYGGVAGLTGALIGPDGTSRNYPGALEGTPVFIGCSDVDIHVAKEHALETANVLTRLGGRVTLRLYPNMGHEVNQDEVDFVRGMMADLIAKQELK